MGRGFQHLELQVAGNGVGVPRQQFRQAQREVRLLQMARRDVDADRDVQPVAPPQGQVVQRLRQHPVAHVRRQPGVLDQRQELHRRDQALLRVFPAQQGLETEHATAAHVHLGLVMQHELLQVQRLLHAANGHHAFFSAPPVLGVEEQVTVAAGLLGAVHGVVGVAQQGVGVAAVHRIDGGPHAGGHLHLVLTGLDHVGQRHHPQHALDRHAGFIQRARPQQQHEFVATQPRRRIFPMLAAAQRAAQPACQFRQQTVAGGVPVVVVDRLEAVQVQAANHQQVAVPVCGQQGFVQQNRKPGAVGQAGQFVDVRLSLQLFALHPLFGDVRQHQHVVAQVARGPQHRGDRGLQGALLAASAPLGELAAPVAAFGHAGPHQGALTAGGEVGRVGAQQCRHGAHDLVAADAQHL